MPTPWLSWPARLARTRWSATSSVSSGLLPIRLTMSLASACSACGVKLGMERDLRVSLAVLRRSRPPSVPRQPRRHQRRGQAHQAARHPRWCRSPAPRRPAAPNVPRPAPHRPGRRTWPRSSASVRKLSGSPFGTTTFWVKVWPRAAIGQLAGHVGGELGLDLRIELAASPSAAGAHGGIAAAARSCPSPSRRSPARRR